MKPFILLASILLPSHCFASQQWSALNNHQSIQFTTSYDEVAFNGVFKKYTSTISIDPQQLNNSFVRSNIDVTSIDTKSHDRDQALAEPDWFYFSNFPQATFDSTNISLIEKNHYRVTGILKIRDQEKKITFPLEWRIVNDNHAHANAQFALDRRDFNIGLGEWAEDETIGFSVNVTISMDYETK
ncbi:MAG: YceI family protein [Gammaproteobacteria bacterium]